MFILLLFLPYLFLCCCFFCCVFSFAVVSLSVGVSTDAFFPSAVVSLTSAVSLSVAVSSFDSVSSSAAVSYFAVVPFAEDCFTAAFLLLLMFLPLLPCINTQTITLNEYQFYTITFLNGGKDTKLSENLINFLICP